MKLLVIGASAGTGLLLTQQGLIAGHTVTAFSRNADQMPLVSGRLVKCKGDFHQRADVEAAVPGHDVVVITASLPIVQLWHEPRFYSKGTALVLDAMVRHGVRKIVILSNLAAGDGMRFLKPAAWLFTNLLIRGATRDHTRQEYLVRKSGLEWTIARPSRLTYGPARGQYQALAGYRVPDSIARSDVAAFLLEAATTTRWANQILNLGG